MAEVVEETDNEPPPRRNQEELLPGVAQWLVADPDSARGRDTCPDHVANGVDLRYRNVKCKVHAIIVVLLRTPEGKSHTAFMCR